MQGSFSPEAVELYAELINSKHNQNFSETENYDFARCIRPDGTSFGTAGKCTSPNRPAAVTKVRNSEADKLERQANDLMSGGRRHSRSMQAAAARLRALAEEKREAAEKAAALMVLMKGLQNK